jgi:hypothetical protein
MVSVCLKNWFKIILFRKCNFFSIDIFNVYRNQSILDRNINVKMEKMQYLGENWFNSLIVCLANSSNLENRLDLENPMLLKELIDCAVKSLDICGNTVMYAQASGKLSISLQLNALLSGNNKRLFLIIYCKN